MATANSIRLLDVDRPKLLHLIPKEPNPELIEALKWLIQEAHAGRITGLVFGAMLHDKACVFDGLGEAVSDPVRAVGVAQVLAQHMTVRVTALDLE